MKWRGKAHVADRVGGPALCGSPTTIPDPPARWPGCRQCMEALLAEHNCAVDDLRVMAERLDAICALSAPPSHSSTPASGGGEQRG